MSDMFSEVNTEDHVVVDPEKKYLEDFVGEGKKFKDTEALARGKFESDAFIARLQKENDEMRQELQKRLTLEEFMDQMSERENRREVVEPNGERPVERENASEFKLEDIEALLEQRMQERDRLSAKEKNMQTVAETLSKAWGENAQVELNRKARELGLTVQDLKAYAEQTPAVFYRLVGVDSGNNTRFSPSAPAPSSVATDRVPLGTSEKNLAYYNKMKKESPKQYWSREVQAEMHRQAQKLGENFFK